MLEPTLQQNEAQVDISLRPLSLEEYVGQENFKENLEKVFIEGNDKILKNLDIIVDNLEVVLRKENIDI